MVSAPQIGMVWILLGMAAVVVIGAIVAIIFTKRARSTVRPQPYQPGTMAQLPQDPAPWTGRQGTAAQFPTAAAQASKSPGIPCSHCGHTAPIDSAFCPSCGAPIRR